MVAPWSCAVGCPDNCDNVLGRHEFFLEQEFAHRDCWARLLGWEEAPETEEFSSIYGSVRYSRRCSCFTIRA
ncbi:hypothetical protein MRX96_002017 [Rhipicephalus microplus]